MLPIRRLLAPLVLMMALAAGCCGWEAKPAPLHPVKATTGNAFEAQTLYSCTGSTGNQIVFAVPHYFASTLVRTGVIWVKPHAPPDASGSTPTTPIPSANAVANGWVRLGDNQGASWGVEGAGSTASSISFFDVWCETQGDLLVVAH